MHTNVFRLLDQIKESSTGAFTGLGLIFYTTPLNLPVAEMGDQSLFSPTLPMEGSEAIAKVLADISTHQSPWHDGFHLIEIGSFTLTHVSQFFAPPLELLKSSKSNGKPIGARQMAAIAGSKIPTVAFTALINSTEGELVFRNGSSVNRYTAV